MIVDVGSISAAQEIENYCLNNLGRSLQGYQANRRYPFPHRSYRWDRYLPYEDRISYIGSGLLSRYDLVFENWGIIITPGHTEDSVSFFNEDTRELVCGDLILGQRDGNGYLNPFYSDKKTIIQSFHIVHGNLLPRLIYPGHGEIIRQALDAMRLPFTPGSTGMLSPFPYR